MALDDEGLVVQFKNYAHHVVAKYSKIFNLSDDVREELLAVAYLALVESVDRYDQSMGTPFLCYASYRIKGSVLQELNRLKGWKGVKPEKARLKLQLAYNAIREADVGKVDLGRVLNVAASAAVSFGLTLAGSESDVSEAIVDLNSESPETALIRTETQEKIKLAISTLLERDQFVLNCYYFKDMTFDEIALALFEQGFTDGDQPVSKSWVSRMHSKALEKMKKKLIL
jgi:RNA polymerase sigma factor FliA